MRKQLSVYERGSFRNADCNFTAVTRMNGLHLSFPALIAGDTRLPRK